MIRVNQVRLQVSHTKSELENKIRKLLHLKNEEEFQYHIRKRSIDARKKPVLYYSYVIDVTTSAEERIRKKNNSSDISVCQPENYRFPKPGNKQLHERPVIIGTGPAGLFCGLMLARHGYHPLLLERGMDVDSRKRDVDCFWKTEHLNVESNVQFGEGGAGTFSDGKLNTLIRDKSGRNSEVLKIFTEAGADPSIQYDQRPHIGTDVLSNVIKNIRQEIISCGGEVRFQAKVTGIQKNENNELQAVVLNNGDEIIPCGVAVFAIGHSARDTFQMLYDIGIKMEQKEFAMGFRVEHLQEWINYAQYGLKETGKLGAAPYKVTATASNGRGVYSFCMCPGGYVVNASSEKNRLAINGMSYSGRNGKNANSAIIISVKKEDFPSKHPLAGIAFQREMESRAFELCHGKIPVQRLGEFRKNFYGAVQTDSDCIPASDLMPCTKGNWEYADLTKLFPREISLAFLEGMDRFGRVIPEFNRDDVLLSGVESRTSSPVRILRNENAEAAVSGFYPCGEGAGYAGGIMSAAMDGIRTAEKIAEKYSLFSEE